MIPLRNRTPWISRVGIVPWLLLLSVCLGSCQGCPPSVTVHVRRNINTLAPDEIAALRTGIQVMQSRPASDPTSWIYQGNMHGSPTTPFQPAWNTCQHGSYFFLSWHRMYLYYFERILRAASGDPNLTQPYWNYSDPNDPDARQLPIAFRQPQAASNPLFVSQRSPAINAGGSLPQSAVDFSAAFAFTNFSSPTGSGQSFAGQTVSAPVHSGFPHSALEQTPHDVIHPAVGGLGGWMSSFNFAARDPIFWLHHANIDRLWEQWLAQGGGRSNPTDAVWLNTEFEFFDENGQSVRLSGQAIIDTVNQLNYRYNDPPAALTPEAEAEPMVPTSEAEERPRRRLGASVGAGVQLGRKPVSLSVQLVEEEELELEAEERAMVLNVEDIDFDQIPGSYYEIYVNLPEGETPSYKSKYYVGNLPFFGIKPRAEREEGEEAPRHSYNITEIVRKLKSAGEWREGEVKVTFVRRGVIPPPGIEVEEAEVVPVRIRRVTITTE